MNSKVFLAWMAPLMLAVLLSACSKDDDGQPPAQSRQVKLEVTGNYTGTVHLLYTNAPGGTQNDQITLPFTKNITYEPSVMAIVFALAGNGGAAGQTVRIKVTIGNTAKTPVEKTVDATGNFSFSTPGYTF